MHLSVRNGDDVIHTLHFEDGPVYIGRQQGCQVFLPDLAVSRQHAVLYTNKKQEWQIEDLGSSNKTYLNDVAVHKHPIVNGDVIRIGKFVIEISMDRPESKNEQTAIMSDTMVQKAAGNEEDAQAHQFVRHMSGKEEPLSLPIRRVKNFMGITTTLARDMDLFHFHRSVIDILVSQFNAFHVWLCMRTEGSGEFEVEGGKIISGIRIAQTDLERSDIIEDVIKREDYILIPQHWRTNPNSRVRSIICGPLLSGNQCYGAVYIDNSMDHESYERTDMDYLIVLSIYIAGRLTML